MPGPCVQRLPSDSSRTRRSREPPTQKGPTALERLGNSSVVYRIGLFRGDDPAEAAVGRFVHVYVDAGTRRVVAVPGVIRATLEARLAVAGRAT